MSAALKIVVLAHALKAGGGISVGKNCVAALKRNLRSSQFWVTVPAGLGYESFIGDERCTFIPFEQRSYMQQWCFENISLPRLVRKQSPDVIISLANRALPGESSPQLMLLHDPHLFYPGRFYAGESIRRKCLKAFQSFGLRRDLPRLAGLLVQTATAENRVRNHYDFTGKITQLPNAISKEVGVDMSYDEPEIYQSHQGVTRLFYLTRYYPHKNIELIVKAFEQFPERLQDCRVFLTISADQHPAAKKLLERITSTGLEKNIINIGPLKQSQLGAYFQHCDALVMPSTLESFSGTYLEAMAFKTPILTSQLDFAEEVCADAALYFDPWKPESLCRAIERLIENPERAKKLSDAGVARLRDLQWDWDKNAERIEHLLQDVLNKG